jgi:hypothetical protein
MANRNLVPWAILLVALGWLGFLSLPHGPTLLIVLTPAWLLVVGLERKVVDGLRSRAQRVAADIGLGLFCVLLLSLGGLWVLPAVVAFAMVDLIDGRTRDTGSAVATSRIGLILGAGTALAIVATLVLVLYAPLYSTAGTSISSSGVITETQGRASLAEVGFPLALGLLIVGLAGAVLFGAILEAQRAPGGRLMIGFVAASLATLAILGGFSIGLFLVPAAVMAALTFAASGGRHGPGRR